MKEKKLSVHLPPARTAIPILFSPFNKICLICCLQTTKWKDSDKADRKIRMEFLKFASMKTLIVEAKDEKEFATVQAVLKALKVSFRKADKSPYDPAFVAKIEQSVQEVKEGKVTRVKKADLQNLIGL